MQLPRSGKRCAEPATAATAKTEMEVFGGGDGAPHKRVKPLPPPPQAFRSDLSCDVLDEPSPLGLRLRKSPSLLDLIQTKLSQAKSASEQFDVHNNVSDTPMKKEVRSGAPTAGERPKASNFPANVLRIGSWEESYLSNYFAAFPDNPPYYPNTHNISDQYISHYEGDLVAKCYFAKHKLVWEVLHDGLKSKIEIQWSDIIALKATCPENEQEGILDLVLARPPLFFKETNPQPRKHTLWQAASDFTDGQASVNRRHTLQCPSSLLSKNFEKLIQCDHRLHELSQQPDAILQTPHFEPKRSIFENPNESKDCFDLNGLKYEHEATLPKFTDPVSTCVFSSLSKNVGQPMNIGFGAGDFEGTVSEEPKNCNQWNQFKVPGLKASISVEDLVNHLGNCRADQRSVGDPPLTINDGKSKEVLEDLVQYLFSDTQSLPASDDKYLMARVDSLYSLLEKDTVPAAICKPECSDDIGINFDGFEEELNSSLAGAKEPLTISRKDSFGELLLNLPPEPSIPQFLFNLAENSEK